MFEDQQRMFQKIADCVEQSGASSMDKTVVYFGAEAVFRQYEELKAESPDATRYIEGVKLVNACLQQYFVRRHLIQQRPSEFGEILYSLTQEGLNYGRQLGYKLESIDQYPHLMKRGW